jgi:stage III sporulation protein SpoIIIAA
MVEYVQNLTSTGMVIDEVGRLAEVEATLTYKESGVWIIALHRREHLR